MTYYVRGSESSPSDVFIATPSRGGQPHSNYVYSLAKTMMSLAAKGITADYCLHSWDCHVDDSRNTILRQFMETECPILLFIDDDVGWEVEAFLKILSHDEDIVVACYPLKQDDEDYPVRVPAETALVARDDGLVEVEGAGTGFMAIKRPVIEKMLEINKHRRFRGRTGLEQTIVFERTFIEGHRWSGDLNFCREWRAQGGTVCVDPEMTLTHQGMKTWEGHLGDHWRQKHGVVHPGIDEAIRALQAGDNAVEHFANLFRLWRNPFAAGPSMLATCYDLARELGGPVLETGTGLTTLVMAAAGVEVHSLEHDLDWAKKTTSFLTRYGMTNVKVHYAPLMPHPGGTWYTVPPDLPAAFSIVVNDGPPRRFGRDGLHLFLGDRIKDAVWVADDMDDMDERAAFEAHTSAAGRAFTVFGNPGGDARQFAVSKAA
jgi:hypothetical protein